MSPDYQSKLKAANTLLALVVLLLLGQAAWQAMRVSTFKSELQQARRELANSVERLANKKLEGRREEMVRAVQWLDEFYRSDEGLQRPGGLCRPDVNTPDGEALAVWILDVYLHARISGSTEEEAREAVARQIRATDEWRRRHPRA